MTFDNFASGRDALPDTANFYSQWTMPSLRTLRARNLIPVLPDPLLSKVMSCRLELDYNTDLFAGGVLGCGGDCDVLGVIEGRGRTQFYPPLSAFYHLRHYRSIH